MTLSFLVATTAQLFIFAIIARAVLSWFPGVRALTPVSVFLHEATNPILQPIQQRLRPIGGFDFSPIVAILLISVLESLMLSLLAGH
jgi:YggT family protein